MSFAGAGGTFRSRDTAINCLRALVPALPMTRTSDVKRQFLPTRSLRNSQHQNRNSCGRRRIRTDLFNAPSTKRVTRVHGKTRYFIDRRPTRRLSVVYSRRQSAIRRKALIFVSLTHSAPHHSYLGNLFVDDSLIRLIIGMILLSI